jgi:PKD repeat protein
VTGGKKCPDVSFQVTETEPKAGSPISFLDQTEGSTKWEWDFGDSTDHVFTQNPSHTYAQPNDYIVTLKVNDQCEHTMHIKVASPYIAPDTNLPVGVIKGPTTVKLGETATFKDESSDATEWEWSFADGATAAGKEVTHKFLKAGLQEVNLIINNGKSKTATVKVNVIYTQPVDRSNPNPISEPDFVKKMNELHNPDISYLGFQKYLGENLNMPVTVNGKQKVFSSYCKGLSMDTKYSVKSVKLTKDKNGYITAIDIIEEKSSN